MTKERLVITPEERAAVAALVKADGKRKVAENLGLNLESLLRILAGEPIRQGTIAMLRNKLPAVSKLCSGSES